jgi:hypothetical protein
MALLIDDIVLCTVRLPTKMDAVAERVRAQLVATAGARLHRSLS